MKSVTAGVFGPSFIQDWKLFEKPAAFNHEKILEQVTYAKKSEEEVTLTAINDPTKYTNAKYFQLSARRSNPSFAFQQLQSVNDFG